MLGISVPTTFGFLLKRCAFCINVNANEGIVQTMASLQNLGYLWGLTMLARLGYKSHATLAWTGAGRCEEGGVKRPDMYR